MNEPLIGIPVEGTPCKVEGCDFVVPFGTRHATNSLLSHHRNTHGGWAETKRVKPQFQALIEATGSVENAIYFADHVIQWGKRPTNEELVDWALDAERREAVGQPAVTQQQVDRMERRLRKAQEWRTRKTLDHLRKATDKLSREVEDTGTTAKPQLLQYLGMDVNYITKEVAVAYPAPVTKQKRRSGGTKVVGVKPVPKALPAGKPVEAEFRVVEEQRASDG